MTPDLQIISKILGKPAIVIGQFGSSPVKALPIDMPKEPALEGLSGTVCYCGPPCSVCGTITFSSGKCYLCPNCGTSNGCS